MSKSAPAPAVFRGTAAVLLALHALLAWLTRVPGIMTGQDDAKYLLLGRALRHFSYREAWVADHTIHAQYPPGFPAFLAVVGAVVDDRFAWLVAANIAVSVAALYLTWRLVRERWSDGLALCVLAALAFNPLIVGQAGVLMSESLFMLLSVSALVLLAAEAPGRGRLAAAGALAIAAALTRSAGIPILAAVAGLWLLQRRWKAAAAFLAASAVTVGGWLYWTVRAASVNADSYVRGAAETFHRLETRGTGFLSHLSSRIADTFAVMVPLALAMPGIPGTIVDNVLVTGLAMLGLAAGLVVLWKKWRAAALYLIGAFGLIALWPWTDTRFFVPLAPLLVPALLAGLAALAGLRRPAWGLPAAALVALVIVASGVVTLTPQVRKAAGCKHGSWPPDASCVEIDQASFFAATQYIDRHLPADAIMVSAKPAPLYFYSHRPAVAWNLLFKGPDAGFVERARAAGAGWVLLGSLSVAEPGPVLRRLRGGCDHMSVVASFPPRTWLFRLLDAPAPDSTACAAFADYQRANFSRDFFRTK